MKIVFKKQYGSLLPYSQQEKDKIDKLPDGAVYEVDVKTLDMRTIRQNSAMHKYFSLLANELNNRNLSVTTVLKPEIMWNTITVKEAIWKPIQKALLNKTSTAKLNRNEISEVYDVVNKAIGMKFGFYVPFPSIEE